MKPASAVTFPLPPKPEARPTFVEVVAASRARLEAASREWDRLKKLPIYPHDPY